MGREDDALVRLGRLADLIVVAPVTDPDGLGHVTLTRALFETGHPVLVAGREEAEKVGRDTMLARIVQMVAEAQRSRAPIQRLADQVSGWFVPLVVLVAGLAFVAWAIWGPEPRLAFGLVAGVLVITTGGLEAGIAMHVLNNFLAYGFALAYSDMTSALNPTGGSWWQLPVTLTQSLVYLGLATWVSRRMGIATTTSVLEPSQRRV